jgi:protein transport protein SEC23
MGFAAEVSVITTPEFKVMGAIGMCSSLKQKNSSVSDSEIGEGGSCAWRMGGITPESTLAMFFEIANPHTSPIPQGRRRHLQIITTYQHSSGQSRMRVTTCSGAWHSDMKNPAPVQRSFDQEAAVVLMARIATSRTQSESTADILRWLDRSLIRLCSKFANYEKDNPASFRLDGEYSLYPQFMFHLRRSQFLQTSNASPDESTYYRLSLIGETASNSLVMIQPSLIRYSFKSPPTPVLLDTASINPDEILLLDTFFHVVIHHGATIASWREQNFQAQPDHVNFKNLLAAPPIDAQIIMEGRFPVPRYIVCDQGESQSRFLKTKLNPSTGGGQQGGEAPVFTDDVSLKVFMQHLVKFAVAS